MSNEIDMQTLTKRLLSLWEEQVSLMGQDPELMSYGESMFKAMGMSLPNEGQNQHSPSPEKSTFSCNNEHEDHEPATQNGAASDALSSQQHATMVDELTRRIDELACQIAEHERGSLPPETEG